MDHRNLHALNTAPSSRARVSPCINRVYCCLYLQGSCRPLAGGAARSAEFKIGYALSLTGPNAVIGKITLAGAQAGINMINSTGGIGGMKAVLVICDVQSVEQQAVICARKLALQDKVSIVLGTGSTPQTLAIIPTLAAAGVPLFSIASGSSTYSPVKKWVFKGISGQADTIPPEVDYLKSKNMRRVAMIHDNGPLGSDISKILKDKIAGSGIEIVDTQVYSPTDTDVTAQVTHMRSTNPDAVLNVAITPPRARSSSRPCCSSAWSNRTSSDKICKVKVSLSLLAMPPRPSSSPLRRS